MQETMEQGIRWLAKEIRRKQHLFDVTRISNMERAQFLRFVRYADELMVLRSVLRRLVSIHRFGD